MNRLGPERGGAGEMAHELAVVGVEEEYSAPWRKGGGVLVRRGAFGVKREVFAVAKMPAPARRLLRKRLISELDAVRDSLSKAELVSCGARSAGMGGRLLAAAEAPVEEEGCSGSGGRSATRRKVSPFAAEQSCTGDRERLAGRLASLAAVLPDHVVAFLQSQRAIGDCDSRGDECIKIEKDVQSMKGGTLFLKLKILLDKFAPESTPPKSHGRAPAPLVGGFGGVCDKLATVEEEEEGVDICGGVSRIAIGDIAEEYGELVEDMGVKLLSPLQRKYVDLAEQGEYVDICGDASPVVFPTKISSSPSLSSSDSDSSSSSFSDSGSDPDPDKSARSRSPPAFVPKEIATCAQPPEAVHTAAPEGVQDQRAPSVPPVLPITTGSCPAPPVLLPKVNGSNAQLPEPAPETTVQIAHQQEDLHDQCTAATPTVHHRCPVTSIPEPSTLPKEKDTYKQPPLPAPEAVQIAEPEELHCRSMAATATVHPITGNAPPSAVLLPEENGTSEMAPAQVAEPEELHGVVTAPAPGDEITDLVTLAKEEAERRRQLAKERAKAEARRVLVEVERAAMRDQRVHRRDMELLGLAAFEHVTSTVKKAAAAAAAQQVSEGGGLLRVFPGGPSILQQLGVFLKEDDGSDDDEQQPPAVAAAAMASHVEDMEVEDGEIR